VEHRDVPGVPDEDPELIADGEVIARPYPRAVNRPLKVTSWLPTAVSPANRVRVDTKDAVVTVVDTGRHVGHRQAVRAVADTPLAGKPVTYIPVTVVADRLQHCPAAC
jgi:hypothetical protein